MSQARGSAALIKRLRCLAKLGLAVSVFVSASGCVETVGIEDVNLDDGGGPGGATGGVIITGATGGSGPTTSSTGGGSAGIGVGVGVGVGGGTAGAGGATGSAGAGGNAGAGGGAGGARPDAGAAGGGRDAGIADARTPDVVVVVGGVTFSMDVRPILQARCSGCHAFSTYNVFTTHAVAQCGGDVLARANDPANSGFLELVQGQCGGFLMPRGCGTAPCIPQAEINTVTSWIRAGAPNN